MDRRYEVIVVGSCNTDLISYVPHLPRPGETLHGHKFQMGCGGKGANQCVAAARLSAKTAMVAKVGNDVFGSRFLETFKEDNIDTSHVYVTNEAMTGAAPIFVDDKGENSIVIVSGANMLLREDDILKALDIISTAKVVVCQLEIPTSTTHAALALAKKHNVTTILNPAPASNNLNAEIFPLVDFIVPNETEAEILTGQPVRNVEDAKAAALKLVDKGCGVAIITLADKGAVFVTKEMTEPLHVKSVSVKVVDTTGAGDAFIGALAYLLLSDKPRLALEEIIHRACRYAACSVQHPGTQSSYLKLHQLPPDLFTCDSLQ